jgi:hypothetical protein
MRLLGLLQCTNVSVPRVTCESMGRLWLQVTVLNISPCFQVSCPRTRSQDLAWLSPIRSGPSPVLCLVTPLPLITVGPGSVSPQGRGWSGWGKYIIMVTLTTAHPLRAAPPSPETHPRMSSPCSWALSPQRTQLCITVQEAQWGDFSVRPDTNLHARNIRSGLQESLHIQSNLF